MVILVVVCVVVLAGFMAGLGGLHGLKQDEWLGTARAHGCVRPALASDATCCCRSGTPPLRYLAAPHVGFSGTTRSKHKNNHRHPTIDKPNRREPRWTLTISRSTTALNSKMGLYATQDKLRQVHRLTTITKCPIEQLRRTSKFDDS